MFRQERPQAGRLRQFHQFGAEAIGGSNSAIDAEIIALAVEVYAHLGIRNFSVKINSVGCEKCRPGYREKLKEFLTPLHDKLSPESKNRLVQNPLRILDSKDEGDLSLTVNAPLMKDHLCEECTTHFAGLQAALSFFRVSFTVDGRIVRGLDYYTKTAFEIISGNLGSQDALAGGGRYDLLIEQLGGKPTPGVGFAAGIERMLMVMEKQQREIPDESNPMAFIAAADERGRQWAIEKAMELRRSGISCETDLLDRSLKAQMREADRQRARVVIIAGEQEVREDKVTLKHMASGRQTVANIADLAPEIQKLTAER
jgi:histidyl-tRNA synthetase